MGVKKVEQPSLPCSIEEKFFADAESFKEAAGIVLAQIVKHGYYHHYTQLPKLLDMIKEHRWLLSRCDNVCINDLKEPRKFGGESDILKRTYIACFGQGLGESAAMWGLYGKSRQSAVRVTIPGDTMIRWMQGIDFSDKIAKVELEAAREELDLCGINGKRIKSNILSAKFRDIIYVAVNDKKDPDRYDALRSNSASWGKAIFKGRDDEDFADDLQDGLYAGWVKDYEWQHERECRLCVRLNRKIDDDKVSIKIPGDVLADMRFTFSPWLPKEKENSVEGKILQSLNDTGVSIDDTKRGIKRFRRSTLHGALNFTGKPNGGKK